MGMGDAWYLEPSDVDIDSGQVYDARDAWAQSGYAVAPDSISDSWSFNDILKAGTQIASEVLKYKPTELPGGGTIYSRVDPITGKVSTGGRTIMPTGLSDFFKNNAMVVGFAGVAILLLMNSGTKKRR